MVRREYAVKSVRRDSSGHDSGGRDRHHRKQSTPIRKAHKPVHILSRLRQLKQNEEYLIPYASFARVVKDILTNVAVNTRNDEKYFKIQRAALDALRVSSEAYLVQLFEDMALLVTHAKRKTLMHPDFELIKRLRASFGDRIMMALQSESKRF